jgi:uncharacterized membrane protein YccC
MAAEVTAILDVWHEGVRHGLRITLIVLVSVTIASLIKMIIKRPASKNRTA